MACDTHLINKSLFNAEYERKKELERRRILRLLQVRQQSKDFADKLRETIKAESLQKRNATLKLKKKQMQEKQLEEMKLLKDIYGICIKNVGSGHREAAKQPDINLLKELEATQKSSEAALRGAKARKKQLDEKFLQEEKIQAPIEQKAKTRNRENMRSYFISCLPKQSTVVVDPQKQSSRSPKKVHINKISESDRSLNILREVPSNVVILDPRETPCSGLNKDTSKTRLSNNPVEGHTEQVRKQSCDEVGESTKNRNKDISDPLNDCSCDYVVCSCHSDEKGIRRRCYSESTVSSEHTLELKKPKIRTRSCSPQTVRTLNYCSVGNAYESKEQNFTKVKHHPKYSSTNLEDIISKTPDGDTSENIQKSKELIKKTEERSLKALQREQLKKDFQQLLQDLRNLNREKLNARSKNKSKARVYQRERDISSKHENKQKKLADAFESLIKTLKHSPQKSRNLTSNMYLPRVDPSSPPTLNLASYEQNKVVFPRQPARERRVMSPGEATTSETQPVTFSRLSDSPEQAGEQHSGLYPVEEQYSMEEQFPKEDQQSGEEPSSRGGQFSKRRHHPMKNVYDETDNSPLISSNQDKPQPSERSPESGTSYYSLPENFTHSQKDLLDSLLVQVKTKRLNKKLMLYIQKLLSMSRESIENLSPSPSLDAARTVPSTCFDDESMVKMTELFNAYACRLDQLVNSIEGMDNCDSPTLLLDPPEHIAPDWSRNPPSSKTIPKHKSRSPSPPLLQTISEHTEVPDPSRYQEELSSGPISHSPTQQHHRGRSSLRQLASEIRGIQTPFGLPSNLLPNPKEYYGQTATSSQFQDQHNVQSSPNESDDSTNWAFDGLPTPPVRPAGASPIDDNKLFMDKFGYLPEEGWDDLDLSNLSTEMKKILGVDNLRTSGDKGQFEDDFGAIPQTVEDSHNDKGAEADYNQAGFYDEDFEGNTQHLDFLRSHLQS